MRRLPWLPRDRWLAYVASALVVAVVAAGSMMFEPLLDHVPTAGLVAAVLLAAWFGGFAPALAATFLAAVLLALAPPHEAPGHALAQITDIVIFVAVAVVVSRLVSTRRRIERERHVLLQRERQARAQAERLSQAKDDFLATVSHELRSPLTAIIGWVQVVRRQPNARDVARRALETVERNALLQARLIDDLLDASRIVGGGLLLRRARLDLVTLVRDVVESHRPNAGAKHLRLGCSLSPEPLPVIADAHRMAQVVGNVLANAIKFTPTGGAITVDADRVDDRARVTVTDSGPGIDPEVLPHIFERFRQGKEGRAEGGLGLGLAIVEHLVTLHGGAVRVVSAAGRGTTFVIELPLADARQAHASSGGFDPSSLAVDLSSDRLPSP